jgi:predicted aspartyl protease
MSIVFRYRQISRPGLPPSVCPVIPVILTHKESIEVSALLDSGADFCAIPQGVAEILGVGLSGKREKIRGIGGEAETIQTRITITIERGHERYSVPTDFKVVLGHESDFPVILGRKDFFERFKITFDEKERKVVLKKN